MSSILEGYNYDIFISYRQKDNKYDGWVTEFVVHLKDELESVFKEEISVYFDINPHDGLLETHDVDASLKDKLNCLVFIPIVSRTYCDPRSFAWQHEFKSFIENASRDKLGLKIKLRNGNVANRVLPVKIHELDDEDKGLLEKELSGTLRSIDFIYKEPGVNRPLSTVDDENKNLNGTNYRNQINKTANSIREIITSLKKEPDSPQAEKSPGRLGSERNSGFSIPQRWRTGVKVAPKTRVALFSVIAILLCAVIYFGLVWDPSMHQLNQKAERNENSIAVLPFENMSDDHERDWFGDAMTEEIIMQLYKINALNVRSRTSVMRYKNANKPISTIAKELKTNFIIEGSTQIFQDKIRIRVQLIDARKDEHLWGETFVGTWDDLLKMQIEIAKQTAINLKTVLSPEEKVRIEKDPTKNSTAYMNYLSANVLSNNAFYFFMVGNKFIDSISFVSAIEMYDKAIAKDQNFALAYAKRALARSMGYYVKQLDQSHVIKCREDIEKAIQLDKDLADAQIAYGFYYFYCIKDYKKALLHFRIASVNSPESYQALFYMAMVYRKTGDWVRSQELIEKVIDYDPQDALILTNIGLSYNYLRNYDSAVIYHDKAIEVMPNWSAPYRNKITSILLRNGNVSEARNVIDTATARTGKKLADLRTLLDIYESKYEKAFSDLNELSAADFYSEGEMYLTYAWVCDLQDSSCLARAYYDSALAFFKERILKYPDDPYSRSSSGLAYAGSGNRAKAVEAGIKSIQLAGNDGLTKSDMVISMAKIYVMTGDYVNALRQIEYLLKNPTNFSIKLMQVDPEWKPIINRPEFKNLSEINYKY